MIGLFARIFLLLIGLSASQATASTLIIDGDTIDVDGVRYRINGIDAPEVGQKCGSPNGEWPCGQEAVRRMAQLAEGKITQCDPISKDGYGRTIATCFVNGVDIGAEMVRTGYAWAFVKYSDVYVPEEQRARLVKIGIWQGDAQPPWEFRAKRWEAAEQEAPDGCPIKGNISRNGRIYHPPWSPWYDRTRINTTKGEMWFCSEADAVAAGWRAPRWR